MEKEVRSSSLLAILAVMVALVWSFGIKYRPGDFIVPSQFSVLAEIFAEKCGSAKANCKAVLRDGYIAGVSYNKTLLGPQVLIHPAGKDAKVQAMGLGRFLRQGGLIVFDPSDNDS